MKNTLIFLLLLGSNITFAQTYFEGEIQYKNETIKKDSSFDLTKIISWPSKKSVFYFKNGDWIQKPDTGMIEYQYFNHRVNQQLYKIRDWDTVLFYRYNNLTPEQDSVRSTNTFYKTDTLLGKVCNRFVLQTASTRFTFVYSPDININPEWFKATKGGYYDIIYGTMKALYLKVIIETDRYISIVTADMIQRRPIPDETFPVIEKLAKREL